MLIYSFTTYSSAYYIWDICDTKVINGSLLRTRSQDREIALIYLLRAPAALPDDQGLIPRTYLAAHNYLEFMSQGILWPLLAPKDTAHMWYTYIEIHIKIIHKKKKNKQ